MNEALLSQPHTSANPEARQVSPFHLQRRITRACEQQRLSISLFGRRAANDPALVFDLRKGRQPRASTLVRILAALEEMEGHRG